MILKYYENTIIPPEIHKFYDDLATLYLKASYDYGTDKDGKVIKENIGRYKLNKVDIALIDEDINLSYLVFTKEGYEKQDEIVINYDKYIVFKALKEIIENFLNETIILDEYRYTDGKNYIPKENLKYNINTCKITLSGLYICSHVFDIRKLEKFFSEKICYVNEDNIPLSYYLSLNEYDLSYLVEDELNLVFPNAKDDELSSEDKQDEFIGQNQKDIVEQLKKELEEQKKSSSKNDKKSKITKTLENVLKKVVDGAVDIGKEYLKNKLKEKLKEFTDEKEKNSYIITKNKKNIDKIKEKFKKDYGDDKYTKYFEDVTNRKINKKDEKPFNEILKSVDKKDDEVVKQVGNKKLKKIVKKEISIIEYLYNLCQESTNPLDTLEESLLCLSAKYYDMKGKNTLGILTAAFKSKAKKMYTKGINKLLNSKLNYNEKKLVEQLGLADVDDIKFLIPYMSLSEYEDIIEYKFLKMFKEQNLVKKSFNRKAYKKSRRLLDNLQLALVKSITRTNYNDYDGFKNRDDNIFNKYIIYLDELVMGLDIEEYSFLFNLNKKIGITSLITFLIKSNLSYKTSSLEYISTNMLNLKYEKYTDNSNTTVDKSLIQKCFPSFSSLQYNMILRNAINIASFYEGLYEDKKNSETMYFVCDRAKISCTNCPDLSTLNVFYSKKQIERKNTASIKDKAITPFKSCAANKVCTPDLSDFEKKANNMVGDNYALMSTAKSFCKLGGVISIVDPNQKTHSIKNIENMDFKKKYEINDYIPIDKTILDDIRDKFFSNEARNMYKSIIAVEDIEKNMAIYLRFKFKAKIDEKKLENETTIVAVERYKKALVNIYPLGRYIKGYYIFKNFIFNKTKSREEELGYRYANKSYNEFILLCIRDLKVLYSPYDVEEKTFDNPYWMDRVYMEYEKNKDKNTLKKSVIKYHKYGGEIIADIRTPWCASFVNYIMDNGLKSPSSQCFYKEGKNYYKRIDKPRYGCIVVFKYGENRGHVSFFVSETNRGIYCLGGNQGGVIKKSYYEKNDKIVGYYWPK